MLHNSDNTRLVAMQINELFSCRLFFKADFPTQKSHAMEKCVSLSPVSSPANSSAAFFLQRLAEVVGIIRPRLVSYFD